MQKKAAVELLATRSIISHIIPLNL